MLCRRSLLLICSIAALCLLETSPLRAQQTTKENTAAGSLAHLEDFSWSLGGLIFSGYEFLDHQDGRGAEKNAPNSEKSGFVVSRAYINFNGKVKACRFRGWNFRITTDLSPAGEQADGCGEDATCEENNDYNVIVKYAFLSIPLAFLDASGGENILRLGQQHSPLVDAKAGHSLQGHWGHRYVAKTSTEDLGLSSSTDRGIAFIHKQEYLGLHLLFANGEGYHHNNAESPTESRMMLRNGTGDSTAMDIYGLFSLVPTGKDKDFHLSINFPFRLQNITEISKNDITAEDEETGREIRGDRRSFKDLAYGLEIDLSGHYAGLALNFALGSLIKKDKRGTVHYVDTDEVLEETREARDASGFGHYASVHFRWAWLGAFYRYSYGSAVSGSKGRIEAIESHADQGNGRFTKRLYGLTFFPSAHDSFFRISVGVEDLLSHPDEKADETDETDGNSKKDRQTFIRTQLKF